MYEKKTFDLILKKASLVLHLSDIPCSDCVKSGAHFLQ